MGNCSDVPSQFRDIHIEDIPTQPPNNDQKYTKRDILSIRFGEVQKIKMSNGNYKIVLPLQRGTDFIIVQIPILSTYSDFKLYEGAQLQFLSMRQAPIFDIFDIDCDRQIYHKTRKNQSQKISRQTRQTVKIYSFTNYRDKVFKNGIYQIYLYQELYANNRVLKDYFIIQKGQSLSLVMTFQSYQCSLFDLLYYRNLSNFPWSKGQQVYIADTLIKNYRWLLNSGLAHRDIRPSKIFLKSRNSFIKFQKDALQFANLEGSRKMRLQQLKDPDNLLLTVRGVPYCSGQKIKSLLLDGSQGGIYHYQMADREALVKVIASVVKCDHYNQGTNFQNQFPELYKICIKLTNRGEYIQNISQNMSQLAESYLLNEEYGKLSNDITFSQTLSKKLLLQCQFERIKFSYLKALFAFHQKDLFMPLMMQEINRNYQQNNEEKNIELLHRLGKYYQSVGTQNNEYFREQINLLVNLARKERENDHIKEHIEYINHAQHLQSDIPKHMKNPLTMANLYVQKAYKTMFSDDVKDKENALYYINQAMIYGSDQNNQIPIVDQLRILQSKGVIQRGIGNIQDGNQYFEKGLEICVNKENFRNIQQYRSSLGSFQYWLGRTLLDKMADNKSNPQVFNKKNIGKAEVFLTSSIENREGTTQQLSKLIYSIEKLGDLYSFIQNHEKAKKCYQRSNTIIQTGDCKVSRTVHLRILMKLKNEYEALGEQTFAAEIDRYMNELANKKEKRKQSEGRVFTRKRTQNKQNQKYRTSQAVIFEQQEQYDELALSRKSRDLRTANSKKY